MEGAGAEVAEEDAGGRIGETLFVGFEGSSKRTEAPFFWVPYFETPLPDLHVALGVR